MHKFLETVAKSVGILAAAFRVEADEALIEAYKIGLHGCPPEKIQRAVALVLQGDHQFMPTPGKLRLLALTGVASIESRADIAWHEFDRAVSHHGGERSVSFDDGLINATVNSIGGWVYCCDKIGDDYFVWLQKQFKEVYCRLCQRGNVGKELRAPLVGRIALSNVGYPQEQLDGYAAYTGQIIAVATSQPVLMPPSDVERKQIARQDRPRQISAVLTQSLESHLG